MFKRLTTNDLAAINVLFMVVKEGCDFLTINYKSTSFIIFNITE